MFFTSRFWLASAAAVALSGCLQSTPLLPPAAAKANNVALPKNIIMIVSDGMGPAVTTAYRLYRDDPSTPEVERVIFDDILVGQASTYPAPVSGYITDSAAAATALATGIKTYNKAIGLDVDKQPLRTVMHAAKEQGMRTGIAVTSQINHATPAAYLVHNENRNNYDAIADSMYDFRVNGAFVADVMLGGGTQYFEREDRDLVAQFIDAGYAYVDSYNKLATLPPGSNVLGLFDAVGLPPVLDDKRANRLAYMTEHAVKHLNHPAGYFLLIEASQVDWGGHSNDIVSVMSEMHDLDLAMQFLRDYVKQHPDTLVILTADHATGGLSIAANGEYRWSPEYIRNMRASVGKLAKDMATQAEPMTWLQAMMGFTFSDEDVTALQGVLALAETKDRETALKTFLDKKTNTGWTTPGHTGEDVGVYAFGPGAERFRGQLDNTDIARIIFDLLARKPISADTSTDTTEAKPWYIDCGVNENWHCD